MDASFRGMARAARGGYKPDVAHAGDRMLRESVFVCRYGSGETEHVGHVVAWDDREAAELFAREIELEPDAADVRASEIRVVPAVGELEGAA
jgi:hypothetical protein